MIYKSDIKKFDNFFLLGNIKKLIPVKNLNVLDINDYLFIDTQKELILKNTKYFILNKPASNALLWGERGNGKSSLILSAVKKINKNIKKKIKIIEILNSDIKLLPELIYSLSNINEKFIIFIDDISFGKNEENFKTFKVMLQGSMLSYSKNILYYVTSNIRNLSETNSQDLNELEQKDNRNNVLSLQERFGIKIGFYNFSKEQFISIVLHYAKKNRLKLSRRDLEIKSMSWSIQKGSLSGRVASQFINDYLINKLD